MRRRIVGTLIGAAALTGANLALLGAGPAAVVTVGDEASFRTA